VQEIGQVLDHRRELAKHETEHESYTGSTAMALDLKDAKDIIRRKEDRYSRSYQKSPEELFDIGLDALALLPPMVERITELESMLCESEAISLHNFQRYEAAICKGHIANMDHRIGWSDLPEEQRKVIIEVHRKMLHMEGKI
jgi:hypothetical protein